jgi:octaprenyl-diphosphate synthase
MPDFQTIDIKRLFDAYGDEIGLVEDHLKGMFQSDVFIIPVIGRHLLDSGGKRIRPLFLLSSARLCGYEGSYHIALASIIETVHTASLLHDDVVDGADVRRGRAAAHSIWGNQVVILVGDFLYSNALKQTAAFMDQNLMQALSAATTRMTQGEVLQLQKLGDPDITEDEYMEIISSKTGALISAACRMAAILCGRSDEERNALGQYGLKAGMAFQMADDILDYMAEENDLGKRLGKDLEEGKVTLPVIHLLKAVSGDERTEIRSILENDLSEKALGRMMEYFRRYNVIEDSARRAKELVEEAKAELMVFPPSQLRDDMFDLAEYALQREK